MGTARGSKLFLNFRWTVLSDSRSSLAQNQSAPKKRAQQFHQQRQQNCTATAQQLHSPQSISKHLTNAPAESKQVPAQKCASAAPLPRPLRSPESAPPAAHPSILLCASLRRPAQLASAAESQHLATAGRLGRCTAAPHRRDRPLGPPAPAAAPPPAAPRLRGGGQGHSGALHQQLI